MPNQNTPENPKDETNHLDKQQTGSSTRPDETPEVSESPPGVPQGALNNALMRTFRGDITKNLGKKAKPAIDYFVPKAKPPRPLDAEGNPIEPVKKPNKAIVHTFKDDVQHMVRNQQVSLAHIAAAESDTSNRPKPQETESSTRTWRATVLVGLTILFLVIGGVLAGGAYYAYLLNTQPNTTPQFAPAIIFTEARESIDITDKTPRGIMQLLGLARRNIFFSLGSVVELHLVRFVDTTEGTSIPLHVNAIDFLESINAQVPDTFLQTLGLEYLLGIHTLDENVPFVVLTTQSYGHAFAGMLAWEETIEETFIPFLSPNTEYIKPAIAEGENAFVDTVIENLDVRLLRDSDGVIRLLYAFTDRGTIVITTNIRTLIELASRLRVADI